MKQYEKAPAPRNRNRRNGPRGSARASRNLIRHSNRAGLSWSAPRLRSAAGLCSTGVCGTGPEADLPARGGRASVGLLRPTAGSLLRIRRLWLEASASVPWTLRAVLLSSLKTEAGEHGVVECAGKRRRNVEWQSADRKRSALFLCGSFRPKPEAGCNWRVTLSSLSGHKGYAGTRNQRRAAYAP